MAGFKQFIQEDKNLHLTHVSDLIFIDGLKGAKQAVDYLRDMRSLFSKRANNAYTVKWDGAPAIICGQDPSDGKFFVAKKGLFNKTPKLYKTKQEIDDDLEGELHDKFATLLEYLPKLNMKGIYQGDLLFTDDIIHKNIDGKDMLIFHPNTIAYAVEADSVLGAKLIKAKVGIAFHTIYTGSSFDTLKAVFGKQIVSKLTHTSDVWTVDASLQNETNAFTFTDEEYIKVEVLLKDIGLQLQGMKSGLVNHISSNPEIKELFLIFINSLVRQNKRMKPLEMVHELKAFLHARTQVEMDKVKTPTSKASKQDKLHKAIAFIEMYNDDALASLFEFSISIDALKDLMLTKMREINNIKHMLKTKDGFKVTSPEGFVAIAGDKAIKLVDRFEFSQANFNPAYLKGWQK